MTILRGSLWCHTDLSVSQMTREAIMRRVVSIPEKIDAWLGWFSVGKSIQGKYSVRIC